MLKGGKNVGGTFSGNSYLILNLPKLKKLHKNINAYKLVVNAYIADISLIEILRLKKLQVYSFESAQCAQN